MITHTVKAGETLYTIAKLYGVSIQDITTANKIANPDLIQIGQRLIIPVVVTSHPTISRGSKGTAVVELQRRLVILGYDPGLVDGIFGPATDKAVKQFQKDAGLVVDGIVGPKTWAALLQGQNQPPESYQHYTVMPGDTLAKIAARFGVSVRAIVVANNIANPDFIYAGQVLLIPPPGTGPVPPQPPPPPTLPPPTPITPSPDPGTEIGWVTDGKNNLMSHFSDEALAFPLNKGISVRALAGKITPILTKDSVYIQAGTLTVGSIHAFDLATGAEKWALSPDNASVKGNPAYYGGLLYACGENLYAIRDNGTSGTIVWQAAVTPQHAVTVAGDRIYVPASGPQVNAPNATHAIDAKTGQIFWIGGASNGPVAVTGNRIYQTWKERLYIYEDQGASVQTLVTVGPLDSDLTPPAIQGQVFVGSANGSLYCLDPSTGSQLWKVTAGGSLKAGLAADNERVYVVDESQTLRVFSKTDGRAVWSFNLGTPVHDPFVKYKTPTPAVVRKVVLATTPGPTGGIIAFSASTGEQLWSASIADQYKGGSPAVYNGTVAIPGVYNLVTFRSS